MNDNVIQHDFENPNEFVTPRKTSDNNGNGGGNMDNKYVTHTELELSNQKLLRHMDEQFNKLDKKLDANQVKNDIKFEEQKVWLFKELAATAIFIITILGFLITLLEFLK